MLGLYRRLLSCLLVVCFAFSAFALPRAAAADSLVCQQDNSCYTVKIVSTEVLNAATGHVRFVIDITHKGGSGHTCQGISHWTIGRSGLTPHSPSNNSNYTSTPVGGGSGRTFEVEHSEPGLNYTPIKFNTTGSAEFKGTTQRFTVEFTGYNSTLQMVDIRLKAGNAISSFTFDVSPNTSCAAQSVTLNTFEAQPQSDHLRVVWETVSETETAGFNLWRGTNPALPEERLNEALIASQSPGGGQGAAYQWSDTTAQVGTTYYYWLEAVGTSGATDRFGPVEGRWEGATAIQLGTLAATPTTQPSPAGWAAFGLLALAGALGLRRFTR